MGRGKMDRDCKLLGFIILLLYSANLAAGAESEISAHVGTSVSIPCRIDTKKCGDLHSVKWYRDTSRIYVFSHAGKIARAEGDATERMTVDYKESSIEALLKISPVEVEDEATYKCEITYLEVREDCDVVQIVKLLTLVKPEAVRIIGIDGVSLSNSSVLGPKDEGSDVEVICEAIGGKPIPKVSWYNGSTEVTRAFYSQVGDGSGIGTGRSVLKFILSKGDLNARFECRVESPALDQSIVSWIMADVHVRPTRMELSGVKSHVVQDTNVLLICDVYGARPAAEVKWFNGSSPIVDKNLIQTTPEDNRDGTFTTKSSLVFKASRYENGKTFHCYAENEVTRNRKEPALHDNIILEVQYPPVISVFPENITVNETASPRLMCNYFANPQELQGIVWAKNGQNLTLSSERYQGGTVEIPALIINKVTRDDLGEYTCSLKNSVGAEKSEDTIYLNVQFPPDVEVVMDPPLPVKAVDKGNVTLQCNVTLGNPTNLTKVRWFLDGHLIKELPECNYTEEDDGSGGPLCGIEPHILGLENVEESLAGNYTCQGLNAAGWGPESEPRELIVYYPPSPANLTFFPSKVVKKASVTLECTVESLGRPENVKYLWYRGSHLMSEIVTANWTISPVTLEARSNFTCIVQNEGGQSLPATTAINVLAPPSFIQNLPPYQGVIYSQKNISLTCRVECWPICSIIWFKDGHQLDTNNNPLYYVETSVYPADLRKNDFESIESTLYWNITAWPGKELDRVAPNSNYTCQSYANGIGPGVNSTVEIAVDFAPEEVTVSNKLVNVIEGQAPDPVKCSGKGRPALTFIWKKNSTSDPLSKKEQLQLRPMLRSEAGSYICEATNKHGTQTAVAYFNVQYAPECSITATERDGNSALVCTASANPQEVTFTWKVRDSNDTSLESATIVQEGIKSYLILDSGVDTFRTYQCLANNTVGVSRPCERDVAGTLPWWKRLEKDRLIIIIAAAIAIILCVIVVCIIIIILCRRKRASTKSPSLSSIGDKTRLGAAQPGGGLADPNNLNDLDKGFYENLPFHGMQNPPNKPYKPDDGDLEYADLIDDKYGPINYKAASIYAALKKNKTTDKLEEAKKPSNGIL